MPSPDFQKLAEALRASGYTGVEASLMCEELYEHYQDLIDDLRAAGFGAREAARRAGRELGSFESLVDVARHCRRQEHWAYRYPVIGRLLLPVAIAALPEHGFHVERSRTTVAMLRWGAIVMASATITLSMLLAMQLAITLS